MMKVRVTAAGVYTDESGTFHRRQGAELDIPVDYALTLEKMGVITLLEVPPVVAPPVEVEAEVEVVQPKKGKR